MEKESKEYHSESDEKRVRKRKRVAKKLNRECLHKDRPDFVPWEEHDLRKDYYWDEKGRNYCADTKQKSGRRYELCENCEESCETFRDEKSSKEKPSKKFKKTTDAKTMYLEDRVLQLETKYHALETKYQALETRISETKEIANKTSKDLFSITNRLEFGGVLHKYC